MADVDPNGDINGEVVINVNGAALSGWTEVDITRRIEGCPNDFKVSMTEDDPANVDAVVAKPGDACTVTVGGDLVITGYIDRYQRSYDADGHTVSLTGRGKCQDLVDCRAEYAGGQITGTLLAIASQLAAAYGITVSSTVGPGPTIPQFNLTLGETAYDIIERIARYAGVLAYEDVNGNLVLANTSTTQAASGFSESDNVLAAQAVSSLDGRFQTYEAFLLSMDVLADTGSGGNLLATYKDPFVTRNRKMAVIAEAGGGGQDVAMKRALWEAARRAGRSAPITVTADCWRDSAGTLWTPNTQAPIDLPTLKATGLTWTLGEVVYRQGDQGTMAEVTLMLPGAFTPEPILIQPQFVDVAPAPSQGSGG